MHMHDMLRIIKLHVAASQKHYAPHAAMHMQRPPDARQHLPCKCCDACIQTQMAATVVKSLT